MEGGESSRSVQVREGVRGVFLTPLSIRIIKRTRSMSTSYRRIDTTDPRRHDRVQPLSFPSSWNDDSVDFYGFFLTSATLISGAAMVTRTPILAFVGLIFGLANFVHDKPHQAKKDAARSPTSGPLTGILYVFLPAMCRSLIPCPLASH